MRGGDGAGLRAFNERLVIAAIAARKDGALSKAAVARATGLSGQAARNIVDRLEAEGLLIAREKVRGQVGQPSTPYALNPAGAYALGLKIGRRRVEARLVDFLGQTVAETGAPHPAPLPGPTLDMAADMARGLLEALPDRAARDRVVGLGLAIPGDMHEWAKEQGLESGALEGWRGVDAAAQVAAATGLSVEAVNDATAACAAEALRGGGVSGPSALYIHVGAFVGGGVILNGQLQRGETGNAGALGAMPMPMTMPMAAGADPAEPPRQLLHVASAMGLERLLDAAGAGGPGCLSAEPSPAGDAAFEAWAAEAAPALAHAAICACAVYDFGTVIVDGVLWGGWRRRLVHMIRREMLRYSFAGLRKPELITGSLGGEARVLGAALLPLHDRFAPDPDLLTGRVSGLSEGAV